MSTFAELKDRAQNMALTEDATTAGAMVNDVYRDIVVQAQLKCTTVDRALTFSDNLYTISDEFGLTDLGQVQYIMYTPNGENQGYVLEPSDLETVLQLSSTSPTGYVRKYAFQGLDNLYLWPSPQTGTRETGTDATLGSNNLTISSSPLANNAFATLAIGAGVPPASLVVTTSTAHGFTAGQSVHFVFPSTSPAFALSGKTFTVIAPVTSTTFTIASTAAIATATSAGFVGPSGVTRAVQRIGLYSGVYTLITYLGSSLAHSASANTESWTGQIDLLSSYDTLQVYYSQEPTALSSAGDIPVSVPTQWHHLISVGAAARLSDAVGEDVNLSNSIQARYDVLFNGFMKWVKNRQGRGTQIMQSGYIRSAGFPNHNRSAYYSSMGND